MSEDNHELVIGFRVTLNEIDKVFLKKYPGEFHLEEQFSQKTGKKIKPAKVWDEKPELRYEIPNPECGANLTYINKSYEDFSIKELFQSLADYFECEWVPEIDYYEYTGAIFHPYIEYDVFAKEINLYCIQHMNFQKSIKELGHRIGKVVEMTGPMIVVAHH